MKEHCTALAAAVQTGTLATVSELNLGLSSFHNDARYSLRDRLIAGCAMAYGVPASDVMQKYGCCQSFAYRMQSEAKDWLNNLEVIAEHRNTPFFFLARPLIERMVIVLSVTGQVSGQGIEEFFSLCFGYSISSSTIDNIRKEYNELAAEFLAGVDLSKIRVGACDEIYSNNTPCFTGINLKMAGNNE